MAFHHHIRKIHKGIKRTFFPLETFHIRHRKKFLKMGLFFLFALTAAIIEDALAVGLATNLQTVLDAWWIILSVSFIFTLVAEYLEEKFEPGKGILERAVENVESDIGFKKRSHRRRKQW